MKTDDSKTKQKSEPLPEDQERELGQFQEYVGKLLRASRDENIKKNQEAAQKPR